MDYLYHWWLIICSIQSSLFEYFYFRKWQYIQTAPSFKPLNKFVLFIKIHCISNMRRKYSYHIQALWCPPNKKGMWVCMYDEKWLSERNQPMFNTKSFIITHLNIFFKFFHCLMLAKWYCKINRSLNLSQRRWKSAKVRRITETESNSSHILGPKKIFVHFHV